MLEFAVEHEMEWVVSTVDSTDAADDDGDDSGHIAAEAFGVDRVREALHSHVWPDLDLQKGVTVPSAAAVSGTKPVPDHLPATETPAAPNGAVTEPRKCGNGLCLLVEPPGVSFKVCSRCRNVAYCSAEVGPGVVTWLFLLFTV
jgi:hypothetical protein